MTKININIELILICIFIIICSFQSIFALRFSYLDEIMLLIMLIYGLIFKFMKKNKKVSIKKLIIYVIFIFFTMINVILKKYNFSAYLDEIFNYLKIVLLFESISMLEIDKEKKDKIMNFFILINIISIFYGIYTFMYYDSIGYKIGDKFRNGNYRISGISGHPISLGFDCLIIIIYLIEKKNKKMIDYFIVAISSVALYLTYSRLVLALYLFYILLKILEAFVKFGKRNKKIFIYFLIFLLISTFLIVGILNSNRIYNYLSSDIDNTIRIYALEKSLDVFQKYPVLGTGIGTFSCTASIKYESYVYNEFNFNRFMDKAVKSSGNFFESFFAKLIIETGIVGLFFYASFFYEYLKKAILNKKYMIVVLICIMIVNLLLNTAYQIPYIVALAILVSNSNFEYEEKK